MQFDRNVSTDLNIITAFGAEGIRVGEKTLDRPCIVTGNVIVEEWTDKDVAALSLADLEPALQLAPEVLILGSGAKLGFPAPGITTGVNSRGIGFEVMDTAAACRTYNVLAHEGRSVAVALLF